MSAPALTVQVQGGPAVSADNLNTFEQTCNIASDLRGLVGITGMQVFLRGQTSIGDGYQGVFYWNATGAASDDNAVSTVVPNGAGSTGIWSRLPALVNTYSVQTPSTGFSITIGNNISTLVLKPAGTLATGTIVLPASPIDGFKQYVSTSQIITALTVNANTGQTVVSAPTTMTAGSAFSMIYVLSSLTWYRG